MKVDRWLFTRYDEWMMSDSMMEKTDENQKRADAENDEFEQTNAGPAQ